MIALKKIMRIDDLRSAIRDYLVKEGFTAWRMSDSFDCNASIRNPVMECRVEMARCKVVHAIGLREKWMMLETVEVPALLWIMDKDGWRRHITTVESEESVHAFLLQHLIPLQHSCFCAEA
jgi:hypothetical protein